MLDKPASTIKTSMLDKPASTINFLTKEEQ
jgi:hypothetical protein